MRRFETLTTAGQARRHRATARSAAARFGLEVSGLRQLAIDTNFVFRVDCADGQRVAMRVMRPFGVAESVTELETWFVEQLAERGLPVGAPLRTPAGERFVTVAATAAVPAAHRCVAWRWLEGLAIDRHRPGYWSALGELIGRLHATADEVGIPAWASPRRWDRVNFFGEDPVGEERRAEALSTELAEVVDAALPVYDRRLAALYDAGGEAPRLIHGDLHDGNVVRTRAGLAVFDFEDHLAGFPLHDLAVALYGAYFNEPDLTPILAELRAAYSRHARWPLDSDEAWDTLRMLIAARALGLVEYCMLLGGEEDHFLPTLVGRVAEHLDGRPRH